MSGLPVYPHAYRLTKGYFLFGVMDKAEYVPLRYTDSVVVHYHF